VLPNVQPDERIAAIKKEVRHAMKVLEEGKPQLPPIVDISTKPQSGNYFSHSLPETPASISLSEYFGEWVGRDSNPQPTP
jgi:hypothetical protein